VSRILDLIGRTSDDDKARFARSADRLQHADALDGLVAQWIASHDGDDVIEELERRRVPVAPVHDVPGLLSDPHIAARGSLVSIEDPRLGLVTLVAPSPHLSATPGAVRFTGPPPGAHNADVYRDLLGLAEQDLAELLDQGAI
jgi:crotonobetainyl-CoA:carnitine CoA-transferase CaiB-like acyl-CoA transferase